MLAGDGGLSQAAQRRPDRRVRPVSYTHLLSAVSMLLSMAPYICIWLAARDLIEAAPEWTQAQNVSKYGWIAFAFAVSGIILYFAGLMCTHLAAFRTASNIDVYKRPFHSCGMPSGSIS